MNILVTIPEGPVRDTFIPPEVKEKLDAMGNVEWNTTAENWSGEVLAEKLKDKDVCICGWGSAAFDENSLRYADRLKIIGYTAGSVANIISEEVHRRKITLVAANWLFAQSLAEGTLAYMLTALRDLPFYNGEVQQGRWRPNDFYNEGLIDQTVGLIGFGMTAQILVSMLRPFHVKIKVFSEHKTDEVYQEYGVERASLEEVITTCKIISIHMAQRQDTYHLINRELLKKIPDGTLLVNTSRGSLIDEEALADELATGRFKAVLDVYEVEPLPAESKLRGLKNAILIPHMGGPTVDRRRACTLGILEDIERFFKGEKLKFAIEKSHIQRMTQGLKESQKK